MAFRDSPEGQELARTRDSHRDFVFLVGLVCLGFLMFFLAFGQTTTVIEHNQVETLKKTVTEQGRTIASLRSNQQGLQTTVYGKRSTADAPRVVIAARSDTRSYATPAPTPIPRSDPLQPIPGAPKESKGVVTITVDRTNASPGDTLSYTIVARNLEGTDHLFQITSHIPVQTSFRSSSECTEGMLVTNSLAGVCPVGARGRRGSHQIHIEQTIPAHKQFVFVFQVIIDPTATVGSVIHNHAHVQGPRIEPRTSSDTRTTVESATAAPAAREP